MLLPLALYGVERRKTWLAAAALASIPLSGQVHLALGAIPFVLAYALARRQPRLGAVAAAAGVIGGAVVWALSLRDTVERPFSEVERYSATLGDFLTRDPGEFERFVYLGWLLPVAAIAGVGCLCFRNTSFASRPLAVVLGLGALVPCLLALGSNLPGYGLLWRNTPLQSTRVPERLLPIACLCLAGLAAAAIACVSETQSPSRTRLVAVVAALVVAADLWVPLYDPLVADEGNALYERVKAAPPGRLLELPALPPDDYAGSVYLYYAMQAPRERPLGYSTSAPPEAFRTAALLEEAGTGARCCGVSTCESSCPISTDGRWATTASAVAARAGHPGRSRRSSRVRSLPSSPIWAWRSGRASIFASTSGRRSAIAVSSSTLASFTSSASTFSSRCSSWSSRWAGTACTPGLLEVGHLRSELGDLGTHLRDGVVADAAALVLEQGHRAARARRAQEADEVGQEVARPRVVRLPDHLDLVPRERCLDLQRELV